MFSTNSNSKENRAFGKDQSNMMRENGADHLASSVISEVPNQELMSQMETFQLIKGMQRDLASIIRTLEIQGRQ